jgi:hydroxyacylglutathione hydrolase
METTHASVPDVFGEGADFEPLADAGGAPGGGGIAREGRLVRETHPAESVLLRFRVLGDNYCYLLAFGSEATVIDPGEAQPLEGFIRTRGLTLSRLLVTHHHADHTGGCAALKRATGCTVFGPPDPRVPGLDRTLRDGERVAVGGAGGPGSGGELEFEAIHAPGHTRTHLAYALRAGAVSFLFSGDCLFPAGCGRVLEGSFGEMLDSLRTLAARETPARGGGAAFDPASGGPVLLAGHEYTLENLAFARSVEPRNPALEAREARFRARTRERGVPPASLMSEERETNPFLRAGDPPLRKALGMEGASDVEVFAELRRRKDRFPHAAT